MDVNMLMTVLQDYERRQKAGGLDPASMAMPNQLTWTAYKKMLADGSLRPHSIRTKESSLTVGTSHLYGCQGLFGLCGPDEIIGLSMGDDPLVSWLGMYPDTICEKFIKGWTYVDQAGTAAGQVTGTVYGDACDDPPQSEKGVCEYYIGDFGTLRACGEPIKVNTLGLRKCDKQPTYTIPIEGIGPVRIDNDLDLETIAAAQVVKHELTRELITGDKSVTGQFDGLTNLIKTGYVSVNGDRCYAMDSLVVDWENDGLTGTVNGHGSIISKVRDMWRRLMWRITQAGFARPAEGDVILSMPSWLAWQFLDEWAWWSIRNGAQYNEVFRDNYQMRDFRDRYSVGLYNGGYITIDGYNIHIMPHDWATISQDAPNFCADIYLLVRSLGGRRVLQGQYIPTDMPVNAVNSQAGYQYFNTEPVQGGRGLKWLKFDNACAQPCVLFSPRLYLETPWCQGKIENVCVSTQFDPLSPDPQSSYFIESNLVTASPIVQYWYDDNGWFHTTGG